MKLYLCIELGSKHTFTCYEKVQQKLEQWINWISVESKLNQTSTSHVIVLVSDIFIKSYEWSYFPNNAYKTTDIYHCSRRINRTLLVCLNNGHPAKRIIFTHKYIHATLYDKGSGICLWNINQLPQQKEQWASSYK